MKSELGELLVVWIPWHVHFTDEIYDINVIENGYIHLEMIEHFFRWTVGESEDFALDSCEPFQNQLCG